MDKLFNDSVEYVRAFMFGLISINELYEMIEYIERHELFKWTQQYESTIDNTLLVIDQILFPSPYYNDDEIIINNATHKQ